MLLEQAVAIINDKALTPDTFPPEEDWPLLEEAIAVIKDAIVTGEVPKNRKEGLVDLISTAHVVLSIAKDGGYDSVWRVLDNEASVGNWLDVIAS